MVLSRSRGLGTVAWQGDSLFARGDDTYHYFLKGVPISRVFNTALRLLAVDHGF